MGYNGHMKSTNLILAAIFFALGFIIAWQFYAPSGGNNLVDNTTTVDPTKVRLEEPDPNEIVTSPLTVKGEVRGTWYFEASFPVEIVDEDGKVLAVAPAQAQGEWMTEDWVPFVVALNFNPGTATKGEIVLKKDNPSGLPENDDEVRLPIRFK